MDWNFFHQVSRSLMSNWLLRGLSCICAQLARTRLLLLWDVFFKLNQTTMELVVVVVVTLLRSFHTKGIAQMGCWWQWIVLGFFDHNLEVANLCGYIVCISVLSCHHFMWIWWWSRIVKWNELINCLMQNFLINVSMSTMIDDDLRRITLKTESIDPKRQQAKLLWSSLLSLEDCSFQGSRSFQGTISISFDLEVDHH